MNHVMREPGQARPWRAEGLSTVMPALVAGIHGFYCYSAKVEDGRDKPGHDG